ncbi:MAG: RnfABCDGE type electron transport complex subunit A [Ruminococcaceae bacterium]|nr:RnfABCDGE type electron transport complex subunit A [Oscillospiraceae bacterium]
MNFFAILSIMITAILAENYIFSKFLGCCPFLGLSENPSNALGMGCAVTFVMTLSSLITSLINEYILVKFNLEYLQTIAFILIIASLVQLIEMFLKKSVPSLYSALGIYLPLITTNCAILGASLLCVQNDYNPFISAVYGFASGIGFTLAIIIFAGVREKVAFADVPKSFKGFPIALVTAGLLAMSFAGFSGITI